MRDEVAAGVREQADPHWLAAAPFTMDSPLVRRGRRGMLLLAVLVGGLADLAYFIFLDLGGFAAPPGPQMTWICASAIVTGLVGLRLASPSRAGDSERLADDGR